MIPNSFSWAEFQFPTIMIVTCLPVVSFVTVNMFEPDASTTSSSFLYHYFAVDTLGPDV